MRKDLVQSIEKNSGVEFAQAIEEHNKTYLGGYMLTPEDKKI